MKRFTPPSPSHARGFTIIELMVSVGLTLLILTLVGRIFNETSQAVRRGADTSQIIAQSRSLSDQLLKDAKEMIVYEDPINRPGQPGAFMVLVQQVNSGVLMPDPATILDARQTPEEWGYTEDIRSDQLAFFRRGGSILPITPGSNASFDSYAKGSIARVWYGHASHTDSTASPFLATEPGDPAGLNERINELVLGRQALLLIGNSDVYPDATPVSAGTPVGGTVYADLGALDTSGVAIDSAAARIDLAPVTNGEDLYEGSTDALRINFLELVDNDLATPPVGKYSAALDPVTQLPTAPYNVAALSWVFADSPRKLIVKTDVGFPFDVADLGRTHGAFIPYVSDFQIDFAADITDDFDYTSPGDPASKTYVGFGTATDELPDDEPDTVEVAGRPGAVRWYNDTNPNPDFAPVDGIGDNDPTAPISWPIPLGSALHSGVAAYPPLASPPTIPATLDAAGGSRSGQVASRSVFVFGHSGDTGTGVDRYTTPGFENGSAKWWPYMLRVRYRLHDRDGTFNEVDPAGNAQSGRWFEQIIPIPRPY